MTGTDTHITPEWSARMAALEPEGCEIGAGALAMMPPFDPKAVKVLCASLDKVLADAIAEAWGRAQKEGMTLYDLSRMLNWSRHRTQRTMKSPVYCRGGLRAVSRLMAPT